MKRNLSRLAVGTVQVGCQPVERGSDLCAADGVEVGFEMDLAADARLQPCGVVLYRCTCGCH